jgi:hypothetical protein
MKILTNNPGCDIRITSFIDENNLLWIKFHHQNERYRYHAEVAMSGGEPYTVRFDFFDDEMNDMIGEVDIELDCPGHTAIMHTRDKETDMFCFVPFTRPKEIIL